MSLNGSNQVGSILVGGSASLGLTGWLTANASLLSLAFTGLSFLVGAIFLLLNFLETKRHNKRVEAAHFKKANRVRLNRKDHQGDPAQ